MREYYYLDEAGREIGSLMAFSFRDAHSWLARNAVRYHSVTMYKPKPRKGRARRVERRRFELV